MGPKGGKGEQGNQDLQRNWKQCAWKNINEGKDSGLIKVKWLIDSNLCVFFMFFTLRIFTNFVIFNYLMDFYLLFALIYRAVFT